MPLVYRDLQQDIEDKIGQVRTGSLDYSFGEIISLHSAEPKELIINPEFQRFFRWSEEQQSRLIESILLELPVPQIFLIENEEGVLELIDGLQRISTVIHFIQPELLPAPNNTPLQLVGCDLVEELNGKSFEEFPLGLRLRIKRSSVRACIIKRQSTTTLRYSMFKRLNTGGSMLSAQEVRNCTSRMVGEKGKHFYEFLQECAVSEHFCTCTELLPDRDQRQDEELVLRFFALKNFLDDFRGIIRDWLDDYMEAVLFETKDVEKEVDKDVNYDFDYDAERKIFSDVFEFLARSLGRSAFVKFRDNEPFGGLAPAYFDAVSAGTCRALTASPSESISHDRAKSAIVKAVQTPGFRDQVGPGASSKKKLSKRISIIEDALKGLVE